MFSLRVAAVQRAVFQRPGSFVPISMHTRFYGSKKRFDTSKYLRPKVLGGSESEVKSVLQEMHDQDPSLRAFGEGDDPLGGIEPWLRDADTDHFSTEDMIKEVVHGRKDMFKEIGIVDDSSWFRDRVVRSLLSGRFKYTVENARMKNRLKMVIHEAKAHAVRMVEAKRKKDEWKARMEIMDKNVTRGKGGRGQIR
ncbi:hypothetical protein RUND412_007703 [Rhizina undulata]